MALPVVGTRIAISDASNRLLHLYITVVITRCIVKCV